MRDGEEFLYWVKAARKRAARRPVPSPAGLRPWRPVPAGSTGRRRKHSRRRGISQYRPTIARR
ncbi:hypothetical protein AB0M95_26580 [Sphaerisporangium sp. NPDC051017]|uniref:hypothetical protein n=1 Tax=Sphaerisporangium sp. NPDC051017 TaxID=3154636 RepID=UPI003436F071